MKTRDLIAALNEADPSGDLECAIGNTDIHFVDVEPGYYDGCLQVLKRDETRDCYNIVGGEFRAGTQKVVIHGLSIIDALWEDPDMEVTFDGEYAARHYASRIEAERIKIRKAKAENDAAFAARKIAAMAKDPQP